MYDDSSLSATAPGMLTVRPLGERAGLALDGEADLGVKDELHDALAALRPDGAGVVHLDLAALRFMDVSCVRELMAFTGEHRPVRVVVHHAPASLVRIVAMLRPRATVVFNGTPPGAAPGRPLSPDIVGLILAEHARIGRLAAHLDRALAGFCPAMGPEPAWAALARFAEYHVDAAEEIAYRDLAATGPDAALAVARARDANADLRAAVQESRLCPPGSRRWQLAVRAAIRAARDHVACVESGALARYQRHAGRADRQSLASRWTAFITARTLDAAG